MERKEEKRKLIERFITDSKELYKLGKEAGIRWLGKYDEDFERSKKTGSYFYIHSEDEKKLAQELADCIADEKLKEVFNKLRPRNWQGLGFRGKYYTYEERKELQTESIWHQVKRDVEEAIAQLGERGFFFLKALIELHREGKWEGDIFGANYADILAKMRELAGKPLMPAPRDFAVLKSYRLYYKSGSNRNPTHSIPEEIIPAVEEVLKRKEESSKAVAWKEGGSKQDFHRSWDLEEL
jgi:hypothetical protein